MMTIEELIANIRTVPDYPMKGILFYDVTTLFKNPEALRTIVERTAENIEHPEDQTVIIMQADVEEEAETLARMLRQHIPAIKDIRIQTVGPVIGAHCGPGTLACCFMGKKRTI